MPYDRARDLVGDAYNAGTHGIGYSQQAMELHDAIIPTQPSLGGQGDARLLADVDERIATAKALGYEDDIGVGIGLLQCVRSALAARQPVWEPVDAIERIARLLYLRSCNRHADGSPYTEWEPMDDRIKDYYRKDAQDYEALRNCALWPAGRENYTAPPAQAVDLGQFRPAVELMEWQERGHANPDFPRGDAKKHAEALRLLALIDSQVVGK